MKTAISNTITFGRNGNAGAHLLHGWRAGEDGFNWIIDSECAVTIPRPATPFGFYVEVHISPHTNPPAPPSQLIELLVDGSIIGCLSIRHPGTFAFFVPGPSVAGGDMTLTLRNPDAERLYVACYAIRVLCAMEPPSQPRCPRSAVPFPDGDPLLAAEAVTGLSARELCLCFETLAGNCEFGGIQRLCGTEPLSLLRFAGASLMATIKGLDTGFAGLGGALRPRVAFVGGMNAWMIDDPFYGLSYHTVISADAVPRDRIAAMEKRKVAFLHRKFLLDLRDAPKIFVCSSPFGNIPEEQLALFLALRRQSPAWLLAMQLADDGHAPGSVEQILPGLMHGYIDSFAASYDGTKVSLPGWLAVLANAWLLHGRETQETGKMLPEAVL